MKIGGMKIEAMARDQIVLPRPGGEDAGLKITVRAFPLGEESPGEAVFPDPICPQGPAKQPNGLDLRDPKTGKVIIVDLVNDPEYVRKCDEASRMQIVVSALSVIEDLEFESTKARGSREWYFEVYDELKKAGITMGDLTIIIRKAQDLSNMTAKKLEKAAESF